MREITKRKCIDGPELDVRQRRATDIQTKSKRKRVSKQKRVWNQPAQSNFQVGHITLRAAPESDQRAQLALPEPDMQSVRSPRERSLRPQAASDCALKLRKAAMSVNGRGRMPKQFQSPTQ